MPQQPPTGTEADPLDEVEEVTAEPVMDGSGPVVPAPSASVAAAAAPENRGGALQALRGSPVVVQAAAVAATGVVAGAMTTALVRAARGRRTPGRPRSSGRGKDPVDVLETRTYVIDVHLVGRR